MKLAWILAAGPAELRRQALERLEWVADTYLSVSTPVQWAAARWLEGARDFQARLRVRLLGNLGHLKEAARGTACRVLDVEGGWYAVVRLPRTLPEEEWALAFLEWDNVLVQPGFFYDFPDEPYAVLSLLTAPGVFREGAGRLLARVREGGA
jgi:hypothetical protein